MSAWLHPWPQVAVAAGKLEHATELWAALEEGIGNATDNVDWYNVLQHNVGADATLAATNSTALLTGGRRSRFSSARDRCSHQFDKRSAEPRPG